MCKLAISFITRIIVKEILAMTKCQHLTILGSYYVKLVSFLTCHIIYCIFPTLIKCHQQNVTPLSRYPSIASDKSIIYDILNNNVSLEREQLKNSNACTIKKMLHC